jgi:predicted aconitase with swiveling domain
MMIKGVTLVAGMIDAPVLVLPEPVSFWGGFDALTGRITDKRHPDHGRSLRGEVVVMHAARGSSSGASVLAEAIRLGTAPAAFVLAVRDAILTVGAQVAAELYDRHCPIVVVEGADFEACQRAGRIVMDARAADARLMLSPHE